MKDNFSARAHAKRSVLFYNQKKKDEAEHSQATAIVATLAGLIITLIITCYVSGAYGLAMWLAVGSLGFTLRGLLEG